MPSMNMKKSIVWGGLLIIFGGLMLLETVVELSPWVWIILLAIGGLAALGLYLSDRADWSMLLTAYVLWAIAIMVALITQDIVQDEVIAVYVLSAIALPFLGVFFRNRTHWWALIPAYVLLVIAVMLGLIALGMPDDLVPAYVLIAIAIPFFVVYARDRTQWWPLIPGGILLIIGLAFLASEDAIEYVGAVVLVLAGLVLLVRAIRRKEPPEAPADDFPPEG